MEKRIINVPKGIRFISDWKEFSLPDNPTIINKTITGCGFTEYCIRNDLNIILCSPRKILLENKESQHKGEVFYVRNEIEPVLNVDRDLIAIDSKKKSIANLSQKNFDLENKIKEISEEQARLRDSIRTYYVNSQIVQKPCKILVTYDSFCHVKEALGKGIENFYIVIDEFQSIFTDSRFKADTELEFMNHLRDLSKVSYVSATPMLDNYLNMLEEFKSLPYYELDWGQEDPSRVIKPNINVNYCQSIIKIAKNIIDDYLSKKYESYSYLDDSGNFNIVESKELVIYVNSVKNICDIIKKCGLHLENTNILCADTSDNQRKIRTAFNSNGDKIKSSENPIGKVPKCDEQHKMFTLCTRTVYLGADFYSTCARSVILSDANIECLAVDISLDLPQILGRQRLNENPWKNRADLYFKNLKKENQEDQEAFLNRIQEKINTSMGLLKGYEEMSPEIKHIYAKKLSESVNYSSDYISVNKHAGSDLIPVFNNLVMVSELRAFEIQQIDYKDRFSVFNCIVNGGFGIEDSEISSILYKFNELTTFILKMKYLCELNLPSANMLLILDQIPLIYKNYYNLLGKDRIKSLGYQKDRLEAECEGMKNSFKSRNEVLDDIRSLYSMGTRVLVSKVKADLQEIYDKYSLGKVAKAKDLEKYYDVQQIRFPKNPETGKRDLGYEILSLKE